MSLAQDVYPYVIVLAASAPLACQLGVGGVPALLIFILFAFPSLSLLISLGKISGAGPVHTYKRLAPIAVGLPWALVWISGERLLAESLRGAQSIVYAVFSLRTRLDWALDCGHSYNTPLCVSFLAENQTHYETKRYPDNFWPAQQFNRYLVRGNAHDFENITKGWEPNEWYLGPSWVPFSLALPSFPLFIAHLIMWTLIGGLLIKMNDRLPWFLFHVCVCIPIALYTFVLVGLTVFTLNFNHRIEEEVPDEKIEMDPVDFWNDLKGVFRSSTVAVDYSSAFTGIILYACSQVTAGAAPFRVRYLLPAMIIVPMILGLLTLGCEGHLSILQPSYKIYPSTDETITFDLLPVCMANAAGGPFWAFIFYIAHFLYSSLAPMLVLLMFIENSVIEQFPAVRAQTFYSAAFALFSFISIVLYMPMGTRLITFFRYVSQSAFVHLFAFALIFLVYGWHTLEADLTSTGELSHDTFISYLFSVSGPICSFLLFSFVPMLLTSKFVAVYDLLKKGRDVVKHIDLGIAWLIPGPMAVKRFFGTLFTLIPQLIVWASAGWVCFKHSSARFPFATMLEPTAEFVQHTTLSQHHVPPRSLAYKLMNQFLPNTCYKNALLVVFIAECFVGLVLWWLFLTNAIFVNFEHTHYAMANMYRAFVLLLIAVSHTLTVVSMRWTLQTWMEHERLRSYIALATLETALLNGYMWMFAWDHSWGLDAAPLILILLNCFIRGSCIFTAIAVRANILEANATLRPRDATEVYEPDLRINENDPEDDTPIIFELA